MENLPSCLALLELNSTHSDKFAPETVFVLQQTMSSYPIPRTLANTTNAFTGFRIKDIVPEISSLTRSWNIARGRQANDSWMETVMLEKMKRWVKTTQMEEIILLRMKSNDSERKTKTERSLTVIINKWNSRNSGRFCKNTSVSEGFVQHLSMRQMNMQKLTCYFIFINVQYFSFKIYFYSIRKIFLILQLHVLFSLLYM